MCIELGTPIDHVSGQVQGVTREALTTMLKRVWRGRKALARLPWHIVAWSAGSEGLQFTCNTAYYSLGIIKRFNIAYMQG